MKFLNLGNTSLKVDTDNLNYSLLETSRLFSPNNYSPLFYQTLRTNTMSSCVMKEYFAAPLKYLVEEKDWNGVRGSLHPHSGTFTGFESEILG